MGKERTSLNESYSIIEDVLLGHGRALTPVSISPSKQLMSSASVVNLVSCKIEYCTCRVHQLARLAGSFLLEKNVHNKNNSSRQRVLNDLQRTRLPRGGRMIWLLPHPLPFPPHPSVSSTGDAQED